MNTNLLNIIKQIVTEQGDTILADPRRVSAFFADLAGDVPKPQKTAFVKSLEQGSAQILKCAPEAERAERQQQLAQKLHEEEGLDLALCNDTLGLLATVLFGEEVKKIFCKNCKKELQQEWKACPFCRAAVTAIETPAAVTSVFCPKCGCKVVEDNFYCHECGCLILCPKCYHKLDFHGYCSFCKKDMVSYSRKNKTLPIPMVKKISRKYP